MKKTSALLACLFSLAAVSPAFAQESPAAAYQKFVEASKASDIDAMLAISSKSMVNEFHKEFSNNPEKLAEMKKLVKVMAPISYKVRDTKVSKDGNSASLFVDAVAMDFFKLNDPKAKPEKENMEVRLVKEDGQWKIQKQCAGKDGCGVEPEWVDGSWGKDIPLSGGASLKAVKGGMAAFKETKVEGKAYPVQLLVTIPPNGDTFSYFLHRDPHFAEFYLMNGGQTITPIARQEEFVSASDGKGREKDFELLKEDVSYSRSSNFTGTGTLSLLFDLPKDAKGDSIFRFIVTYGQNKYPIEIK